MGLRCFGLLLTIASAPALAASPPERAAPRVTVWRAPPEPLQDGRLAAPVAPNVEVGVGRFSVQPPARLRTHTEPLSRSGELSQRERRIAAIGVSLRF